MRNSNLVLIKFFIIDFILFYFGLVPDLSNCFYKDMTLVWQP